MGLRRQVFRLGKLNILSSTNSAGQARPCRNSRGLEGYRKNFPIAKSRSNGCIHFVDYSQKEAFDLPIFTLKPPLIGQPHPPLNLPWPCHQLNCHADRI